MSRLLVVNGPNLDRLGRREPQLYGTTTLAEVEAALRSLGSKLGAELDFFQSNDEAALIDRIHDVADAPDRTDGLVINPAALTHYSQALGDAIASLSQPVVEVHISNIMEREPFRRRNAIPSSYRIYGRGIGGYFWGIRHLINMLAWKPERMNYGSLPDQYGELRHPEGEVQGLAIVVHGGLWMHQWTSDAIGALAVDLAHRGWSSVNLEYRRVGLGGGWPETFEDLAAAIRFLHGATSVPVDRIALVGHSAGAIMALWAGAFHPGPVVALAPFPDLVLAATDPVWSGPRQRFLAGDEPAPSSWSPMHRSAPVGPTLIVAARDDEVSPFAPIQAYANRFPAVDLKTSDGDHMSLLKASSSGWGMATSWLETRKVTL